MTFIKIKKITPNVFLNTAINCIYIIFHQVDLVWRQQKDHMLFGQAATCLPHTLEDWHCPFYKLCWTSNREAADTYFYSVYFDPTGNRTGFYCFNSRRSTVSTDRQSSTYIDIFVGVKKQLIQLECYAPGSFFWSVEIFSPFIIIDGKS